MKAGLFLSLTFVLLVSSLQGQEQQSSVSSIEHGQENAAWTQSIYFRGFEPDTNRKLTDSEIVDLAEGYSAYGIKYAYIFSGPFDKEGALPEYAFSKTAADTVRRIREVAPSIKILPWLGGLQDKTVFLQRPEWRKRATKEIGRLVEFLGVSGIHLDFEYILPSSIAIVEETQLPAVRLPQSEYGPNLVRFHQELRAAYPWMFISTVVPTTVAGISPWKMKQSLSEVLELARVSDQISLLTIDTSIRDQNVYLKSFEEQLIQIRDWRTALGNRQIQFLIVVGTFENREEIRHYRDQKIENISNTLKTLKEALLRVPYKKPLISGIAVFCEWHTDMEEWKVIRDLWTSDRPFYSRPPA